MKANAAARVFFFSYQQILNTPGFWVIYNYTDRQRWRLVATNGHVPDIGTTTLVFYLPVRFSGYAHALLQ